MNFGPLSYKFKLWANLLSYSLIRERMNIVSSPLKLGRFLVFKIWTKREVMKKLLRNRGVS